MYWNGWLTGGILYRRTHRTVDDTLLSISVFLIFKIGIILRDNDNGPLLGCISNVDERLVTILHNLDVAHHFDFILSG